MSPPFFCFNPMWRQFCNGQRNGKQGTAEQGDRTFDCRNIVSLEPSPCHRSSLFSRFLSFWPFWKKTVRRMEKSQLTLRNPFCLSAASFTDFSKLTFFQGFWKIRPRLFDPFVAMTKGWTVIFLHATRGLSQIDFIRFETDLLISSL